MTSKTTKTITREATECVRLKDFKNFLNSLSQDSISASGVDMRNCMTYPVSVDELHAEVLSAVWTHLETKHCPRYFQLSLIDEASAAVLQECSDPKECSFVCSNKGSTESPETQFDLVKLQKFAINNLEKLLTRLWTDNAKEDNLRSYADANTLCEIDASCKCSTLPNAEVSFVSGYIKNKTRKMEDRHICIDRFGDLYKLEQTYSFYGVFDGHSGPLAASYTSRQLPWLLAKRLQQAAAHDNATLCGALEESFLQADTFFARKNISSGTTAVCALLTRTPPTPPHMYIAWVGDSKALLVGVTASLQLVKPHKPNNEEERKRIESSAAGGAVIFVQGQWRVNGVLNVSRSIGDFSVGAVIAEPDIVDIELLPQHDFLVLGTDGLFDHVDTNSIVNTIYTALIDAELKLEHIPKLLIEMAKQRESQDNITVVIIFLNERCRIVENYHNANRNPAPKI